MASRAYHQAWRDKNREKVRASQQKYREKHRNDPVFRAARVAHSRKWALKNKEHVRQYMQQFAQRTRWRHLSERYGVDEHTFYYLLEQQGGVCAICRQPETARTRTGTPRRFAVDHNHSTGKFRGILCGQCNTAIGLLQDDPMLVRRALRYLREAK